MARRHQEPPHALVDAEHSVIGCVLLRNEVVARVHLDPSDFVHPILGRIWAAILELDRAKQGIDPITICNRLNGLADKATMVLLDCQSAVPTSDNVEFYAEIVATAALERKLRENLADVSSDPTLGAPEILERAQRVIDALTPPAIGPAIAHARTAEDHVDAILARASEPWVCLGIGGQEIARLRLGSFAVVLGGTGAGKSSLVGSLLAAHAQLHGPAMYLSLELGADEMIARLIGMTVGASWEDVLCGRVPRDRMVASVPLRLDVRDRDVDDVAICQLAPLVEKARAEFPGEPILAAVDYIQLAAVAGPDLRTQIAAVVETMRAVARQLRIVLIGVSQTSRAAATGLRHGDLVGADTMALGAESSAIERCAYLTLAIGAHGDAREDGSAPVELHIGKARMGGGDRLLPMEYHGKSGLWRVAGPSRSASDVRAEHSAHRSEQRAQADRDALVAAAARATAPLSREQLRASTGISRPHATVAFAALLADGALVECERAHRSGARLLWTPERARERAMRFTPDRIGNKEDD